MESHYLGIEIGGTKLQIGVGGPDSNTLLHLWRDTVDISAGAAGIRQRIIDALPEVLAQANLSKDQITGVGIGFGGPVDDRTQSVLTSHQIAGWDHFPLVEWVREKLGFDAVLGNDSDVAGLAEALTGAGEGLSPIFYMNIGSGIGGAWIVDGHIHRGVGRGAAEIGHLKMMYEGTPTSLEDLASGWALERRARRALETARNEGILLQLAKNDVTKITAPLVAQAAAKNDPIAKQVIDSAWSALADALCHVIALLCPRRMVIGGGVSLLGDRLFVPLRELIQQRVFRPFAECYDVVPAALGEEVVVRGALTLARQKLRHRTKKDQEYP